MTSLGILIKFTWKTPHLCLFIRDTRLAGFYYVHEINSTVKAYLLLIENYNVAVNPRHIHVASC